MILNRELKDAQSNEVGVVDGLMGHRCDRAQHNWNSHNR